MDGAGTTDAGSLRTTGVGAAGGAAWGAGLAATRTGTAGFADPRAGTAGLVGVGTRAAAGRGAAGRLGAFRGAGVGVARATAGRDAGLGRATGFGFREGLAGLALGFAAFTGVRGVAFALGRGRAFFVDTGVDASTAEGRGIAPDFTILLVDLAIDRFRSFERFRRARNSFFAALNALRADFTRCLARRISPRIAASFWRSADVVRAGFSGCDGFDTGASDFIGGVGA